jgi:hypothetical protein
MTIPIGQNQTARNISSAANRPADSARAPQAWNRALAIMYKIWPIANHAFEQHRQLSVAKSNRSARGLRPYKAPALQMHAVLNERGRTVSVH